jgi:BolA protein
VLSYLVGQRAILMHAASRENRSGWSFTEGQRERKLRVLGSGGLTEAFVPETLGVEDESHLHEGHAGARDGRGHFRVLIISKAFTDKTLLQRHRMVYQALGDLMRTDIHALSIDAWSPEELDH